MDLMSGVVKIRIIQKYMVHSQRNIGETGHNYWPPPWKAT